MEQPTGCTSTRRPFGVSSVGSSTAEGGGLSRSCLLVSPQVCPRSLGPGLLLSPLPQAEGTYASHDSWFSVPASALILPTSQKPYFDAASSQKEPQPPLATSELKTAGTGDVAAAGLVQEMTYPTWKVGQPHCPLGWGHMSKKYLGPKLQGPKGNPNR